MNAPSINEVTGYITGIFELMRGEPAGLNHLDLTTSGFWRSFWALVYALPAYFFFWVQDRNLQMLAEPEWEPGAGFFVKAAISYGLSIACALIAVAVASRPLGMSDRFAQWVIATNWLSLPVSYILAAVGLAAYSVSGPEGSAPLMMIVFLAALVVSWRVYRSALGGDGLLAFIVLFISQFVSILVAVIIGV